MRSTLCRTYFKFIRRDLDSTFALGLRERISQIRLISVVHFKLVLDIAPSRAYYSRTDCVDAWRICLFSIFKFPKLLLGICRPPNNLGARGFFFRSEAAIVSGEAAIVRITFAASPLTIAALLRKKKPLAPRVTSQGHFTTILYAKFGGQTECITGN